jgi:hypothetical protein
MPIFICLLLNADCEVVLATFLRGMPSQVHEAARVMAREKGAWGYEIWAENRRVATSYDCHNPPGRAGTARH